MVHGRPGVCVTGMDKVVGIHMGLPLELGSYWNTHHQMDNTARIWLNRRVVVWLVEIVSVGILIKTQIKNLSNYSNTKVNIII